MKILSTRKVSSGIENTFDDANKFAIIISPYLKISDTLYGRIINCLNRGTKVIFIYGKNENEIDKYKDLIRHPNVSIFYLQELHAKAYGNDFGLMLTSMNLHSFSEINNWELGVFFEFGTNPHQELMNEIFLMLGSSKHKYGKNDYSILKFDTEIEAFMEQLEKKTSNMIFEKLVKKNWDDSLEYSFKAISKRNKNLSAIANKNYMGLISENVELIKKIKSIADTKCTSIGIRVYEKRNEVSFYPPDGFNSRLDSMSQEEYQKMWMSIILEIDEKIFGVV